MKEDILEKLIEIYLQSQGCFTRYIVKFHYNPMDPVRGRTLQLQKAANC